MSNNWHQMITNWEKHSPLSYTLIANINCDLKLPIQIMGLITRFNGVGIQQARSYIKISCTKYITKMVQSHPWATQ